MKIREGFVSNSSSTSFWFVYKGNKGDVTNLCDLIVTKYREFFNLTFNPYEDTAPQHCNYADVAEAIRDVAKDPSVAHTVDEAILVFEDNIKQTENYMVQSKHDDGYYMQELMQLHDQLDILMKAKKNGLTVAVNIGFGDNHGDVSGPGLGATMDYEGRGIRINREDLVVFTEQDR